MFPISFEQLGATGTAAKTATVPEGTQAVIVTATQALGYVTFDGSTPGGMTGHQVPLDVAPVVLPVAAPKAAISLVSVSGSTGATGAAVLNVTYLG